jgi:hypothetical protein
MSKAADTPDTAATDFSGTGCRTFGHISATANRTRIAGSLLRFCGPDVPKFRALTFNLAAKFQRQSNLIYSAALFVF